MAYEIERKFLVYGEFKPMAASFYRITQGYLCSTPERTVRVRRRDETAFLTIKGKTSANGVSRYEWEKEIALSEAIELLDICEAGVIDKTRYLIPVGEHVFEVDEFHGENSGLIIAEIELQSEDEHFAKPNWLGQEVTGEMRYYNAMLVKNPFKKWQA